MVLTNMKILKSYAQNIKRRKIDMTLSENPLGCSPRVIKKLTNIGMKTISNYPDTTDLMNTISRIFYQTAEYFIGMRFRTAHKANHPVCNQKKRYMLYTKRIFFIVFKRSEIIRSSYQVL